MSVKLRTALVVSFIFALLDYCLVYNDLTSEQDTKLQRFINRGIRFIFNLRRDEHVSPYRRRLGWLTVKSRRLYFVGIKTYKIIYGKAPDYLIELFSHLIPSQRSSRRLAPATFAIPHYRTSTYRNTLFLSDIYFWHFRWFPRRGWLSLRFAFLITSLFWRIIPCSVWNYRGWLCMLISGRLII